MYVHWAARKFLFLERQYSLNNTEGENQVELIFGTYYMYAVQCTLVSL
jgi:hypothetical protein